MHLLKDEHGNLVGHSHEHEHTHTHTYEHSHPHSHEHGHEEDHDHSHGGQESAAELDQMAAKLEAAGKDAAAQQIKKAVDEFQKGNLYLSLALSTVKEGR